MKLNYLVLQCFFLIISIYVKGEDRIGEDDNTTLQKDLNETRVILRIAEKTTLNLRNLTDNLRESIKKHPDIILSIINNSKDVQILKENLYKYWPDVWNIPQRVLCQNYFESQVEEIIRETYQEIEGIDLERKIDLMDLQLSDSANLLQLADKVLSNYDQKSTTKMYTSPLEDIKNFWKDRLQFLKSVQLFLENFSSRIEILTERKIKNSLIPNVNGCLENAKMCRSGRGGLEVCQKPEIST